MDAEKIIAQLRKLQQNPAYKWNRDYQKGVSDSIGVILGEMDDEEKECGC